MFAATKIAYSDKIEEERIFKEIKKLVPSFSDLIAACHGHRRALLNLIRMVSLRASASYFYILSFLITCQLQNAANGARNDDIAKTNSFIGDYIKPTSRKYLKYDQNQYPMPTRNRGEERGWSHPEYGFHLCPLPFIDSFSPEDYE
jgi:hypothetical protein